MEELLQVAEARPDARFVTAGIGPWRERLAVLENVLTLGQVQSEEIRLRFLERLASLEAIA